MKADLDGSPEGPNCESVNVSGSEKDASRTIPVINSRRSAAGESTRVSDRRLLE